MELGKVSAFSSSAFYPNAVAKSHYALCHVIGWQILKDPR